MGKENKARSRRLVEWGRWRSGTMSHWFLPRPMEHLSVPYQWLKETGQKGTSLTVAKKINKHLTIAVSSPGSTLSFSPTCTTPLHIRPDAAILDPWLLYTFEIGILSGPVISRAGGSSLSEMKGR